MGHITNGTYDQFQKYISIAPKFFSLKNQTSCQKITILYVRSINIILPVKFANTKTEKQKVT